MEKTISQLVDEKKYSDIRKMLINMQAYDIAELFSNFDDEVLPTLYRILPKDLATEVFVEMSSDVQETLISSFTNYELKWIFDEMYIDDAVDVIEEMPASVVKRILSFSSPETRNQINELLKYPKDSAGSLMTTEYIDLKKGLTVEEALEHIKVTGVDKETIYTSYVTDESRVLLGVVSAKTLLLSDRNCVLSDIMDTNFVYSYTLESREEVTSKIENYSLLALPIVDREKRLVGIVTVDDAITALQEQVEEDISMMAAITPQEKPYLKSSPFSIWRARIPWLLFLMLSATLTSVIISYFESALSALTILTAFIPTLMGTGGNSGSQASVTIIRELSLAQVKVSDFFKVQLKELSVGAMCGATLAIVEFLKLLFFDSLVLKIDGITLSVALTVAITIFLTVVFAKLIGSFLPLVATQLGADPAVMASPLITTLVDALSLLVFFSCARAIINI